MKKWIVVIFLLVLSIIITLYFWIPTTSFNYQSTVNCTETAVARLINNKSKWELWWPGHKKSDTLYSYKNYNYKIEKILFNGIEATVYNNQYSVKGALLFSYHGNDSTLFQWLSPYIFSDNPYRRIVQYIHLRKVKSNVESLLADINEYFGRQENIYGMKIIKQKVTPSSMISMNQTFLQYPSTQEIYSMINTVREYIRIKGGEENNHPMLNVYTEDKKVYKAMVAVPVKTDLPSEGKFRLKKLVLGNILMAEVNGGVETIMKAEKELSNYVNDYKKISPAIPFQSLITNRLLETDTSKWITRLYYPIFK